MHHFSTNFLLFLLANQFFLANCCIQHERQALLKFKADVSDPSNRLASWIGNDCCNWVGVRCSNTTGHVIMVNLRNIKIGSDIFGNVIYDWNNHSLSGKISQSLQHISGLKHIDLSFNNFSGDKFPDYISSFKNLNYLNLSCTGLSGMIPSQLGNLSKLQYLDLSKLHNLYVSDVWWLSHLTSLKNLDISEVDFQDSKEWAQALNMLPVLQVLRLGSNNLTTIPRSINVLNFTSLESLTIYECSFNTRIPNWIAELPKLTKLILWYCYFIGPVPSQLGNLTSLNVLTLQGNYLIGPIPPLYGLKNLMRLWIADVNISDNIREVVSKLANDTFEKLEELGLPNNSLTGNLARYWPNKMPNIANLDLSNNDLSGMISAETHLSNLSNLKYLNLGSNSITITINGSWIPTFQLEYVYLGGCKLGPRFPSWLQYQSKIIQIDLSNTEIFDTIPNWFWNISSLSIVDLSHNNISGKLPLSLNHLTELRLIDLNDNRFEGEIQSFPDYLWYINLSDNFFSGPLPSHIKAPRLIALALSNNFFNGTIDQFVCGLSNLQYINLEKNNFSGYLPHCWSNTLKAVNMAHNKFCGTIPSSIASSNFLQVLQLNGNSLNGELPSTLQICRSLTILDLGENNFHGQIPEWIGQNLLNLTILRLRSNMFSGNIPVQIVHLKNLQILDLGNNNISGIIPQDVDFLTEMASSEKNLKNTAYEEILNYNSDYYQLTIPLVTKGNYLEYTSSLALMRSIDLSANNLVGDIPEKITILVGLRNLNLSKNHLTGPLPLEIGEMQSIESLDLRMNELSGMIPPSLCNLNFLTTLNISYNNLSGEIPTGNQLQTLDDPYIYVGNENLCGHPLQKRCNTSDSNAYETKSNEDLDQALLYLFVNIGFIFGVFLVWGTLLFGRNWRYCFLKKVDNFLDWLREFVVVHVARMRKD